MNVPTTTNAIFTTDPTTILSITGMITSILSTNTIITTIPNTTTKSTTTTTATSSPRIVRGRVRDLKRRYDLNISQTLTCLQARTRIAVQ
ncbi:unnamed protein product [Dibothriocephalus latus]|uniref:Uncharacterized protein n=1 Tax=Dibothriocephalus latus TaxID=60516 RepID=A0A3P7N0I0_DIBLA|nr:unnamed protein product [Dibothriocephalus latus]